MYSFLAALAILIVGYIFYGKWVDRHFGADPSRETPAHTLRDGVDFVPLPWHKIFLIQFLNIAGLGPIFGAIMGALYGPAAFLWIAFGCVFGGAVHDYFSGMLSVRHQGQSIPEIVGNYLGEGSRKIMRGFSVILLVLVGVVFMMGPAGLLANLGMKGIFANQNFWLAIIIAYYFIATVLPVDKVISKIYPLFGLTLLIMAVGVGGMMIVKGLPVPELTDAVSHPKGLPIWPMLFITIACGAISGFHATQSPMMSRCLPTEAYGRRVFYGAMIAEGVVALIWAAAAMSFFPNGLEGLNAVLAKGGAGLVVNEVSVGLMGTVGGMLAILGVIACPITSGDTAFRSVRLIFADALNISQTSSKNRLMLAVPIFAIGFALTFIDFNIIWRYFAFSNQALATIVLWASAMYMVHMGKSHWLASLPATFMTAVCTTYIMMAPEGLGLSSSIAYPVGAVAAIASIIWFLMAANKKSLTIQQAA
ncbi:carbon starvation CstA family protein [Parendozoicomonas haliclonae]|uniref:Inner membrane protein YjiY n=1 Tax=Parendozoicomonas haliclonae TaxID=1960125 RepID=A0A1X7AH72_9GAMM|nr:carbon starvation protein A [Parendozoicomonas haliclonae]SMA42104.1 Inner membrane protein YjiY [Parendozoicomonas haliclonae]